MAIPVLHRCDHSVVDAPKGGSCVVPPGASPSAYAAPIDSVVAHPLGAVAFPSGAAGSSHATTLTLRRRGQRVVLRLRGGFTDASREHLAEALSWANRLGSRDVLVDLGGIEKVDVACLRLLRATRALLRRRGGQITVIVVRPEVRLVLAVTGLGEPVSLRQRADGRAQSRGSRR